MQTLIHTPKISLIIIANGNYLFVDHEGIIKIFMETVMSCAIMKGGTTNGLT